MVFITFHEIIDIIIMAFFIGFLFQDLVKPAQKRVRTDDVLDQYGYKLKKKEPFLKRLSNNNLWFSIAVLSPAIILHEMGHKFVAMAFGLSATFHAFYANSTTLFLGVLAFLAKIANFGLVFLVPGFVSISPGATVAQQGLIAFAGPFVHLVFWIGSLLVLKFKKNLSPKWRLAVLLNKKINLFLFILNMLPIPGIDGWQVYLSIFKLLGF